MFDAKPEDRDQIALYIQEIEFDHKPGPDGNLVAYTKITFGKKGTANYQQIYEKKRLQKDNPMLWEHFRPAIEKWEKDRTLVREGFPLESWPAITKGQIKACKDLGMFTVEDIATATSSIHQRLGMGASDLIQKAKAWYADKDHSAQANKIAQLEAAVEHLKQQLEESTATNKALAAQAGVKAGRPGRKAKVDTEEREAA